MSGICSAHKEFVAGCPRCETIGVEKPAMECHDCTATNCVEGCVNWQVYASYLEARLKGAEESLHKIWVVAHLGYPTELKVKIIDICKEALHGLGKEEP